MSEWASKKLDYMKFKYSKKYQKWIEEKHGDDRTLFCNIYNQIQDAINAVGSVNNNYVHVAMNKMIGADFETLDAIAEAFKDYK